MNKQLIYEIIKNNEEIAENVGWVKTRKEEAAKKAAAEAEEAAKKAAAEAEEAAEAEAKKAAEKAEEDKNTAVAKAETFFKRQFLLRSPRTMNFVPPPVPEFV